MQEPDRDGELEKEKDEREVGAVHYALVAVSSAVSLAESQDLAREPEMDTTRLCLRKALNGAGWPLLSQSPAALDEGALSTGAAARRQVQD